MSLQNALTERLSFEYVFKLLEGGQKLYLQ